MIRHQTFKHNSLSFPGSSGRISFPNLRLLQEFYLLHPSIPRSTRLTVSQCYNIDELDKKAIILSHLFLLSNFLEALEYIIELFSFNIVAKLNKKGDAI